MGKKPYLSHHPTRMEQFINDYLCNTLLFSSALLLKRIKMVELKRWNTFSVHSLCEWVLYFFNYAEWKHIVLFNCHCNANDNARAKKSAHTPAKWQRRIQIPWTENHNHMYMNLCVQCMHMLCHLWIKYLWLSLFTCCVRCEKIFGRGARFRCAYAERAHTNRETSAGFLSTFINSFVQPRYCTRYSAELFCRRKWTKHCFRLT